MKKIIFLITTFIAFGCNCRGQNGIFEKEVKNATEFMESKIADIYDDRFKTEFKATWHEFGKINGFEFYIIENKDNPISVAYYLGIKEPFEFDQHTFEKEYKANKIKIRASEQFEKDIQVHYPSARAIANRIENSDGTYRCVNTIYMAQPLNRDKESTFEELNSLCKTLVGKLSEKKAYYNFYFPKEIDTTLYTDSRISFFQFDNFSQKRLHHYRVDLVKSREQFEITNQKLFDHLKKEQLQTLEEAIRKWKNENGFETWKISLLTESGVNRDLDFKKFMLGSNGEKKFGFINIETKELKFVD